MTASFPDVAPGPVDEAQLARDYADVLNRVANEHQPVIVRRDGADLAAIIPLEQLELLQDVSTRREAEKLAASLDRDRLVKSCPPPQEWFDGDEPRPF